MSDLQSPSTMPAPSTRSARERVHPAVGQPLREYLDTVPGGLFGHQDIVERRKFFSAFFAGQEEPRQDVAREDRAVGASGVGVRIYKPITTSDTDLPCVYYIHGGGYVLETLDDEDAMAATLCAELEAVVVAIDYRLAPENPYPAGLDDSVEGYTWVLDHANELGIDAKRIAFFGASAGGGMVLALALRLRDQHIQLPTYVMSLCPMIDDTNTTASSYEVVDVGMWDRAQNVEAWEWYLGGKTADQYAAPTRAEDLTGLPTTFIDVGTVDAFRDEDVAFAARLMASGVDVELHVYPGAYHGAESFVPEAELSQQITAARMAGLARALGRP